MASPLYWPGEYYFYLIGNTSAVSLVRDLPPDVSENILSLPCGDPRNVLYTVFCESPSLPRKLDFTCGDHDPGVLARNVLLLAMIFDDVTQTAIWDIYMHMYLDDDSHTALVVQCRKLLACSVTLEAWHASSYGAFLRVGTEHTLLDLRRLWSFYVDSTVPVGSPRALSTRKMIDAGRKKVMEHNRDYEVLISPTRSCEPLLLEAVRVFTEQFSRYWSTGTTSSDAHRDDTTDTRHANPTFLQSRRGEGFSVHYGTHPLAPFHLAPLFGNCAQGAPSAQQAVAAAQEEFQHWCQAFRARVNSASSQSALVVRFILGDAIHIANALSTWDVCGATSTTPPFVSPWTSTTLELCIAEYRDRYAPVVFDIIDTSNLSDHVGLLNILLSMIPLLSTSKSLSSVLYTELLQVQHSDFAAHLAPLLPADISVITLLLGLCPVEALSGFSSSYHSSGMFSDKDDDSPCRQVLTWKQSLSSDRAASHLHMNPRELASILHDTYNRLFGDEDPTYILQLERNRLSTATRRSSVVKFSRETFVLFLRLVRLRCPIPETQWAETIQLLVDQIVRSGSTNGPHPFDVVYRQDLFAQLHRHQVYTHPAYLEPRSPSGLFSRWSSLPHLARIYLAVPHQHLAVLRSRLETPSLHGVVRVPGGRFEWGFQSVDATFGMIVRSGTPSSPKVDVHEIAGGFDAEDSPLVVSFVVPIWVLTESSDHPETLVVELCIKATPDARRAFVHILGLRLAVYSTIISDAQHVYIVPEPQCQLPMTLIPPSDAPLVESGGGTRIGTQTFVAVDLEVTTNRVASLTARVQVEDMESKATLSNGGFPTVGQASPFRMRVTLGGHSQDLVCPLPVIGSQHRTRLARKSSYIEVVVPVAMPFPDVWALQSNPFPVIRTGDTLFPWNLHRVNLDRLPTVEVAALKGPSGKWFNPHVSLQMSHREREARTRGELTGLSLVKDTIHAIMLGFADVEKRNSPTRPQIFSLLDQTTGTTDTVFFVRDLRYDLACHTIVCDAFVLSLSKQVMSIAGPWLSAAPGFQSVPVYGDEMRTWKQLLPALVERCRTTWRHGKSCEYAARGKIPLELEIMAGDGPLCSCGRGKDVDGMCKDDAWKRLAPFVTRVALSPLFAVPYLEPIFEHATRCAKCSWPDNKMRKCSRCKTVSYCSEGCQKADWKKHKPACHVAQE
ncbi:uncharacterized protein TRAVEDRAFT_131337 [Trametes versicolor FP-101664 SS1]|uniref:uncharacterized protein n=1 Tax=Trametes versicolor (strain FP-101664) TaxID=717944 RepID=UPI000462326E|nr:uncharacterized protein TRAVEDRAFT_131337 [Trametes versicolor FP-101664 SS1]EIW55422.1 hypothetical protein TRAVEDRAFT_131337 [Trametes versicolor FP-101664 SS1]